MGIDSEYYKEKNKKKLIKLRQLESVMPPYVVSYLNDKELSSQINTVIAYAYDLQTFFRFLTEKNNLLKNTAIKNISIDFLECLTFEDINEYQRYLSQELRRLQQLRHFSAMCLSMRESSIRLEL